MAERGISRVTLVVVALVASAVFTLALVSPAIFNDGDTYWHVRAGQWMLAHRAILMRDPFSLALAGRPWDAQEWLSEIAMAGAFGMFGWSGVAVLTGLAMATSVMVLGLYLARHLDPVPCLVVLALAVSCVMPDYLARPHILALPFMTAWLVGLARATEMRRAPHWPLLPVMALWANVHGSFVFGLALLIPFGLESVLASTDGRMERARGWGLFAAGAVAATLLNPRGLAGLLYPFVLMQVQSLSAVGEWQALDLHAYNPVEFAVFAALFFLLWRGVRISAFRIVVLLLLVHLSLVHARYGMLLGIAGAVLVAGPIGAAVQRTEREAEAWHGWRTAVVFFAALLLVCAAARIAVPIKMEDGPAAPVFAFAAVPRALAAEPVFNNYSFGGYLIFEGVHPFVDSRADFYGDAYLAAYARAIDADKTDMERLFAKYGIKWTILKPADPLVQVLDRRPGWHRIFTGPSAVVQAGPTEK